MLVTVITPSNAAIFPEYIIPNIKHLVQDPEVSVRCMYAQCIVHLADTSVRYLEMGQALKAHGTYKLSPHAREYEQAHFEVSSQPSRLNRLTDITCRYRMTLACKNYKTTFRNIFPCS
jgi:phosphoinositide-3-kinase regulatory subunit 4